MPTEILTRHCDTLADLPALPRRGRRGSWQRLKGWAPGTGLVAACFLSLLAASTASADLGRPRISVADARRSTETCQGVAEKKAGLLADCFLGSTAALPQQRCQTPDRHRYELSEIATDGLFGAANEMQAERWSARQPIAKPSTVATDRPRSHDYGQRRSRFSVLGEYVKAEVWRFAVVAKIWYCQRFEPVRQWYANSDRPTTQVRNPDPHRANLAGYIVRQQLGSEHWKSWACWLQTAREVSTAMGDFGPRVLR